MGGAHNLNVLIPPLSHLVRDTEWQVFDIRGSRAPPANRVSGSLLLIKPQSSQRSRPPESQPGLTPSVKLESERINGSVIPSSICHPARRVVTWVSRYLLITLTIFYYAQPLVVSINDAASDQRYNKQNGHEFQQTQTICVWNKLNIT